MQLLPSTLELSNQGFVADSGIAVGEVRFPGRKEVEGVPREQRGPRTVFEGYPLLGYDVSLLLFSYEPGPATDIILIEL